MGTGGKGGSSDAVSHPEKGTESKGEASSKHAATETDAKSTRDAAKKDAQQKRADFAEKGGLGGVAGLKDKPSYETFKIVDSAPPKNAAEAQERIAKDIKDIAAKSPPDMGKLMRDIYEGYKAVPYEEQQKYLKEATDQLHKAGILPKELKLTDKAIGNDILGVEDEKGNVTSYDAKGKNNVPERDDFPENLFASKAEQRHEDVEKLTDRFEKAREKKDLTGVFDEISKKSKELSEQDFKEYIKEANQQLHKAGLLPKGVDIDADGVRQMTHPVDADGNVSSANLTELPVKTTDGSHIANYSKNGTESFLGTSVAHIPDLFESRREQRREEKKDVAQEVATAGKLNFKEIDKDGDNRISKKELDDYIDSAKKSYEKSKNPDELFRLKILEDMRDNFGKIQRASNDDHSGIFGREQGISPEDLTAYAAKMEAKAGDKPAESKEPSPEAKPEIKEEAPKLPAEPADASKKGRSSLLDKRSEGILDPFQKVTDNMWVESRAGDTLYDYAYAAIRKAHGDSYAPSKDEIAKEVIAIAKANDLDPAEAAKALPKGEDLNIPIPKPSDK